jgi:hypothetical protein
MDLYGKKHYLRNLKKKIHLLGHVKRKNGEKKSLKISQKEKGPLESQETDG